MARSASEIVNILRQGTYSKFMPIEHIFDYEQIPERRLYPSIEVVSTPNSLRSDKRRDELNSTFEIRIYIKRKGIMSDEIAQLEEFELEVNDLIQNATLQDYRILFETHDWSRKDQLTAPSYIVSTLKVRVSQVLASSIEQDGVLVFDVSESDNLETAPTADYQYLQVFDTEIGDGYTSVDEAVTKNNDRPVHFSGIYGGTFITNVMVGFDDVGSTADKLNKMNTLSSNGEKPELAFIHTDKDNSVDLNTITDAVFVEVDTVTRMYKTNEGVVFRVLGKTTRPGTLTIA